MKTAFTIIQIFYKGLIHYIFNKRSPEYNVLFNLFRVHSFRLSGLSSSTLRNFAYFFKEGVKQIFFPEKVVSLTDNNSNKIAILHDSVSLFGINKKYIEDITRNRITYHFYKSYPSVKLSWHEKFWYLITLCLIVPTIAVLWIILQKKRNAISLILLNMSEWFYGVSFLRKYGINKFFYFGSFENDAVFFSLLSKKLGVKCVFVTSQNPLSAFYSHIVADEIFFSAPYHEEEFHQLKSNWYVDSFCHVPPFEFKELYSEVKPDPPRYKVGFLSGGSYRRLDWKDRYFDDGFYESELEILRILNEISLDINPIAIFLHPCEKENEELLERAKKFYTQQLTNKKFVFINPHTRSFKHFYEVDLCITVYSSSAQERLFMGYKTLFAPLQVKTRYYKGLSLESVVCYSEAELTDKIKTSLQISNNDFFRYYGLEKYHFNNYNKYLSEVSVWN